MVRNSPNLQRCLSTTSFCFIGMVGTKQLAIFYICFRYQMKTRNPNKIQKLDYTHPNIIRIIQNIQIHICYIHPKVLLFQCSMQRRCSVQQKLVFWGFNSLSSDKNSNKKCKWIKSLKFFYKTLCFWLNPYYLLKI